MPSREPFTPEQRRLQARHAAYVMHSRNDNRATTAKARAKFNERFETEVDPNGTLPEAERKRRAESARKAYFAKLSLKASRARTLRAQGRKQGQ